MQLKLSQNTETHFFQWHSPVPLTETNSKDVIFSVASYLNKMCVLRAGLSVYVCVDLQPVSFLAVIRLPDMATQVYDYQHQ